MTELLQVTNHEGRTFNVRVVLDGDKYGRDDCLTHAGAPMVEFYDTTHQDPTFGTRGQFVSRYFVDTLDACVGGDTGLWLDGGVPEWQVSAENVADALAFAHDYIRLGEPPEPTLYDAEWRRTHL